MRKDSNKKMGYCEMTARGAGLVAAIFATASLMTYGGYNDIQERILSEQSLPVYDRGMQP